MKLKIVRRLSKQTSAQIIIKSILDGIIKQIVEKNVPKTGPKKKFRLKIVKSHQAAKPKPKIRFLIKRGESKPKIRFIKKIKAPAPPKPTKAEQKKLNRALYQALKTNKATKIKALVESGASFAYLNWEGLELAAERGHMRVFETLFDEGLAQNYIIRAIMDATADAADEFGKRELHRYLTNRLSEVPESLTNLNMAGHEDGDEDYE